MDPLRLRGGGRHDAQGTQKQSASGTARHGGTHAFLGFFVHDFDLVDRGTVQLQIFHQADVQNRLPALHDDRFVFIVALQDPVLRTHARTSL